MGEVRRLFGPSAPTPVAWQRTRWGLDPWARGSYSHPRPGGGASSRAALAEPVGERLFFAGEATSDYVGTVHGAWLSGLRAAEEALEVL